MPENSPGPSQECMFQASPDSRSGIPRIHICTRPRGPGPFGDLTRHHFLQRDVLEGLACNPHPLPVLQSTNRQLVRVSLSVVSGSPFRAGSRVVAGFTFPCASYGLQERSGPLHRSLLGVDYRVACTAARREPRVPRYELLSRCRIGVAVSSWLEVDHLPAASRHFRFPTSSGTT